MTAVWVLVGVVAGLLVLGAVVAVVRVRRRELAARPRAPLAPPPVAATPPEAPPEVQAGPTVAPPRAPPSVAVPEAPAEAPAVAPAEAPPPTLGSRLSAARSLFDRVRVLRGRTALGDEERDQLEEALLRADVGVATTEALLDDVAARVRGGDADVTGALRAALLELLGSPPDPLRDRAEPGRVAVWLFVGVNGVGKTTTIGKLARRLTPDRPVLLAAADTFRAAAADQLEVWAQRVGCDLVRAAEGADPGAVVHDALHRASARGIDLVLADTAGRLHNKSSLLQELAKVRRVADREPGQVLEVLLVIDATTGQNAIAQAKEFSDAVGVTGVVLTKLDGTARGGVVLAVQRELGIPVRLVGVGERDVDLVDFDPGDFVDALLGD